MSHIQNITTHNNNSDELTVRYLKKRLKRLNHIIRTPEATAADYINRDRVAYQLQDARANRISLLEKLTCSPRVA